MQKDSASRTILIAVLLCVVCSVMVTTSAVMLRDKQDKNKLLDIKKNLLLSSGLLNNPKASEEDINKAYKSIKAEVVELESGKVTDLFNVDSFDQKKLAKDPKHNLKIPGNKDLGGIKHRSKYSIVYKVMDGDKLKMVVLPINGKGLWSTLYGFIALESDLSTVKGVGFYDHAETPGLGGEVDNPMWKKQWIGKKVFDSNNQPIFEVHKGIVTKYINNYESKVDGLSGATITSNGVTGLVKYWLGDHGFGPFLKSIRNEI